MAGPREKQQDFQGLVLAVCADCNKPIERKILRAMERAFHPHCFKCAKCGKSLDNCDFTISNEGDESQVQQPFCHDCLLPPATHTCAACGGGIQSSKPEEPVQYIEAMDKPFHMSCYKCKDCEKQLSLGGDGEGSFPYEGNLLCQQCNLERVQEATRPKLPKASDRPS